MTRYIPTYVWEIDWDGDGEYANSYADVSEYVRSYNVHYGCRTERDVNGVVAAHALGTLILFNRDDRYNADSSAQLVDSISLGRRNAVRLTVDGVLAWSGLAEPADRQADPGGDLVWNLSGRHSDTITRGQQLLQLEPSTLAGLAQAFTAQSGIELSVASPQPTGQVIFTGSWLYFLQDLSQYGGGWILEDRFGEYQFRRWTALSTLPISASLDLSYGPNENSMRLIDRVPHTRNHAVCRSLIWADPEPATVAYDQVTMGPAQQRWVQLTFQGSAQARPATWDTFVLSDTCLLYTSPSPRDC